MPFKTLGLLPPLLHAIRDLRYEEPTPVQAEAIPAILTGRDVLATAQTGTGKTAAFVLPLIQRLLAHKPGTTQALVLAPTRELAQQIDSVFVGLAHHTKLRSAVVVGGASMLPQEKALRAGVEVLIATPGRLLDHMRQSQPRFDQIHTVVFDEADRMFDMGFLPDLKRIISRLPARKQTLMFSATMPPSIAGLAQEILNNPTTVQIGRRSAPAVGITQAAYPVPEHLKTTLLRHLLRGANMSSVLVFTRTKMSARRLARTIAADGFAVGELHSNLTQGQRQRAMAGFRDNKFQVLVATNIAARGLDVDHITHVISHDVPNVPEDYVHRIGRTARAEAEGDAWILVAPSEEKLLVKIERQIGQRLPRVHLPDFDYNAAGGKPSRGDGAPHRPDRPGKKGPPRAKSTAARDRTARGPKKPTGKPAGKAKKKRRPAGDPTARR